MPQEPAIELSCLVLCQQATTEATLRELAGKYSCVRSVDVVYRPRSMCETLRKKPYDMAIVALDDNLPELPACLLRYPELQVLVVVPGRKTHSMQQWIDQGADDMVSIRRPGRLKHAITRMLKGCATRAKLRQIRSRLKTQYKLQQILLNTYAEALMLMQKGSVIESNDCFDTLIACKHDDNKTRTIEWKRWLSPESLEQLLGTALQENVETTISNINNKQYRVRIESLILEGGPAQLIRINPSPITPNTLPELETDSVTGLLIRQSLLLRLQSLLQAPGFNGRYIAILITLPIPDNAFHFSGVDRTLQDLMIYRAANTLEQLFTGKPLLGRIGLGTLIVVKPVCDLHSRKLAQRIKSAIGGLGGLIEDPTSVVIRTLTLSANTLSATQVLQRLERKSPRLRASTPLLRQSNHKHYELA